MKQKHTAQYQYLCYGIPAGLLTGTVIAVVFSLPIGLCAGLGMLLGVVIGTTIDYESHKKTEHSNKSNMI